MRQPGESLLLSETLGKHQASGWDEGEIESPAATSHLLRGFSARQICRPSREIVNK